MSLRDLARRRAAFAVLLWLAVYPLVLALSAALAHLLPDASLSLRALAMTLLLVPVMVFAVVPLVARAQARLAGGPACTTILKDPIHRRAAPRTADASCS